MCSPLPRSFSWKSKEAQMGTRQAMGLRSFHYVMVSTPGELSVALHWHLRSTPSSGAHSNLPPFLLLFFCPLANSVQECGNFIFGGASPSVQYCGIEHRAFQNQLFLHQSHLLHSFLQRFREGVPAQLSAGPCPVEITQVTVYLSFLGVEFPLYFFLIHPNSRPLTSSPAHPFHMPWTQSPT